MQLDFTVIIYRHENIVENVNIIISFKLNYN